MTVSEVYASWSASRGHISAKTAATRRSAWGSRVEPHWGNVAMADVKTAAVRAWVVKMVDDEVGAPRNSCDGVKLPERQHADRGDLGRTQVAALARAVERQGEVVRFLAYSGLRWGEMAALRVQDFDMLRRRVNVSRSVMESDGLVWSTPKIHERRSASMTLDVYADLFDEDLDGVADRLDAAIRSTTAGGLRAIPSG